MLGRRLRSEGGQDTVEWVGALLLVSALIMLGVSVLSGSGVASSIAGGAACEVDAVFGGSGCGGPPAEPTLGAQDGGGFVAGPMLDAQGNPPAEQGGDPAAASTAPWTSSNPVTRATWGTYLSLGDSYSAGEGLGDYQPGSHVLGEPPCLATDFGGCTLYGKPPVINACDRSSSAYNATVTAGFQFAGGAQAGACSSSVTSDIYDPSDPTCTQNSGGSGRYGEGCQIDRVGPNDSLVTMTIGGNDIGFADDLSQCYGLQGIGGGDAQGYVYGPDGPVAVPPYCSSIVPGIDQRIDDLGPHLVSMLQAVRQRAPHARIIVLTYPQMFAPDAQNPSACFLGVLVCLSGKDQLLINQEVIKLDKQICASVQAAGVGAECVDGSNAFSGCEMGKDNSCMQSPTIYLGPGGQPAPYPGSFHPSALGQQKLGELISREIRQVPPTGSP